jgi:hypothetical protein
MHRRGAGHIFLFRFLFFWFLVPFVSIPYVS